MKVDNFFESNGPGLPLRRQPGVPDNRIVGYRFFTWQLTFSAAVYLFVALRIE